MKYILDEKKIIELMPTFTYIEKTLKERANISMQTFKKALDGESVSYATVLKFCKLLGCNPDTIILGQISQPPSRPPKSISPREMEDWYNSK